MAAAKKTIVPDELTTEIATTRDGRDITQGFIADLQQPRDPRLLMSIDWGIYDRILKDDQVKSCLAQRQSAVVSAPWDVLPGDDKDTRSCEAAAEFKKMIERIGWDRVTEKMLYATFHGYSVAELIWVKPKKGGLVTFKIKVRHARRFRYDKDGNLRMLTRASRLGELVPDRKFWVLTAGAENDDEPYGHGLADWLYWPTLFKRNGIRFWNIFLDKFGTPTAVGKYRRGTPKTDIDKLVDALQAIATDSGIVVPEGTIVELLQAAKSGTGDFKEMCKYMDEAIAKVLLAQTMTTQDGASLSQAKVHAGVKLELVKSDADLSTDSFNEGPARWWTDVNYGPDVAAPLLVRQVDEEADLKVMAETDEVLSRGGWERTDDSFQDTYGDGYRRKPEQKPPTTSKSGADDGSADDDAGANNVIELRKAREASFAASDPQPLYVYRRLKNAKALIAWAKSQGFFSTLPGGDMHVTIAYSKRPVNWFEMGQAWGPEDGRFVIPEGGARTVDRLGDKGAVVLFFSSFDLEYRNREMRDKGASWDFREYHPHLTITYAGGDIDLTKVRPYTGKLVFGPEIFEPLDADWDEGITEVSFGESAPSDAIDDAVAALLEAHGWQPLTPVMKGIIEALEASGTAEQLDAKLLEIADSNERATVVDALARAGFAVRTAAEAGAE